MTAKFGMLISAKTTGANDIKRLGNSMQGVQGKAKNLGMAVKGVGLAFKGLFAIAAVGGIVALGKSAIDTADAFGKLSTRTGIAADKLLAYVNAGKLADVSQSDLETGLRTLARTQVEASEGVATYADAYAKLGVAVKNQDGTLKDSDQLLSDIADRFQDLPNGPEKAAVAMDIFGRSGQKMITLLNGGSEALDEFGFELSENFARNSETFNDNLTKVGIEMDRLKMQILDDLLPGLIDLSEGFIDLTKNIRKGADAFAKFFGIGDEAMIQKNTVLIQALNKNIARTKKLLREQREEAAEGGSLFGIRTDRIEETERLLAEFESKRAVLRREINQATRPVSVDLAGGDDDSGGDGFTRNLEQSTNKTSNNVKEMSVDLAIFLADLEASVAAADQLEAEQFAAGAAIAEQLNKQDEMNNKLTETEKLFESIKDTVATGLTNAIEGLIDGTKSLGDSLSGVLRQMASLFLRAGIGSFGSGGEPGTGLLGLFAKGGVFAQNNVVPFAYGGVVNRPTLFPMANGMGLMGEAGPEAIMPLRRGRGGRLGVESAGGGATNVNVSVDASGSSVEGNGDQAAQLGKAIGIAVQQELIKQKRPGGLLTS